MAKSKEQRARSRASRMRECENEKKNGRRFRYQDTRLEKEITKMKNNILGLKRRTGTAQGEPLWLGFITVDFSQRKRNCLPDNRALAPFDVAKAFSSDEFYKPSATRLPDGQEADCLPRLFGGNTKFDEPVLMKYNFKI